MNLRTFGLNELKPIEAFIPPHQLGIIKRMLGGEEAEHFIERIQNLKRIIGKAPVTRGQEGTADPIVHLHYFYGGCDWWITELDAGMPDDEPEWFQHQMFGFVCLGDPTFAELGYVSLPELKSCGHPLEIDLHFEPTPLSVIREQLEARYAPKPEPEPERSGRPDNLVAYGKLHTGRIPTDFF